MKMKVFSCVLLAVLVVGGLALATTHTWEGAFTIDCDYSLTYTGDLHFDNDSPARDPACDWTVMSDGIVTITFSYNCHLMVDCDASPEFVGDDHDDTMNATWWTRWRYETTDPWSDPWDSFDGGDCNDPPGAVVFPYPCPPCTCDGTGYVQMRVSVDRTGWGDMADVYRAEANIYITVP